MGRIMKTYENFDNTFNQYGIGMNDKQIEVCKPILESPDLWVNDIKKIIDSGNLSIPVLSWIRAHLLKNKQALKSKTFVGKITEEVFSFIKYENYVVGCSIQTMQLHDDKGTQVYPFHVLDKELTYYIFEDYADAEKYDIETVSPTRETLKITTGEDGKPKYDYDNKVMSYAEIIEGNKEEPLYGSWIKICKDIVKYTFNKKGDLFPIPAGAITNIDELMDKINKISNAPHKDEDEEAQAQQEEEDLLNQIKKIIEDVKGKDDEEPKPSGSSGGGVM